MEGFRGTPRRGTVYVCIEKFGGYKTRVKQTIYERERLALRNKVKEEKHLRDIRGVEGRYWNEKVSARLNGLREKAETAISCKGPGPTRKRKETYQQPGGGGRGYKYVPVLRNNRELDFT